MKTRILIFLLLFITAISFQTKASRNDTVWTTYHWGGYKVSILGGNLYYSMTSTVKIEADDPKEKYFFGYDYGIIKPIKNGWFHITPNKLGNSTLWINEKVSFPIQIFPIPEPKAYLDVEDSKWKGAISIDALLKSKKIIVKNKLANFKIVSYTITINSRGNLIEIDSKDSIFSENILKHLQKIEVGQKFYIENIVVKNPDGTLRVVSSQKYKVIDNYNNEFIRNTVSFKPYTYDLNIMKNDLRIKITGHPRKKDVKVITDFANELNELLETIKVKIVDQQPSLIINFDSIQNDSTYIKNGSKNIDGGYLIEGGSRLFYPFNKHFVMLIDTNKTSFDNGKCLKYNIVNLLGEFDNNVEGSIFNYSDTLSLYDKYMLKTLYSIGGETEVLKIIDDKFDYPDRNVVFLIILILSICLLFIFSEIYNHYGFNFLTGKVKSKIIKRIIEALLIAQIPVIAILILLIGKFFIGDFHEIGLLLIFEIFFIPFFIFIGLLFLALDTFLNKIKRKWLVTILNLVLSFFCIWLAYQIMYLFIAPEIVYLSIVEWKILIVPFLITLYRIYERSQTNKISGLLQEKELELTKQKELKFKSDLNALQARINPHFLYNALNSLASLAYIDAARTERMALSLSKLFRYNINKEDEHYSSLKDEIEMTEIYLEVEKNRFEDKLEYNIDVQNDLNEFKIPKFILQPLAENAVKHGISKITGKGIIRIKIFEQNKKVIIEIYDNGPEFPGGLISGYGLQNTYEKFKLLYKKPFEIEFINQPEKKLVIMLTK